MAEVIDWAPVDDDNNAAPPVGAPEGMMPAQVNNTMRAMMGSLRRMYDQIVAGTLALPYLPLAGGTVTGNVAINGTGGMALSGVQLRNISNALEVYHAAAGFVASRGAGAGYVYGDRDQVSATWTWYANGGLSYLANSGAGNVLSVTAAGRMAVGGAVDTPQHLIQGTLFAQRSGDNAHLIYDGDGQLALGLYGATSLYRADSHLFQNNAGTATVTINNVGDLIAVGTIDGNIIDGNTINAGAVNATTVSAGTVTGSTVNSNGNISAAGTITGNTITGNTVSSNGAVAAAGQVSGATVVASGQVSGASLFVSGVANINGDIATFGTVFAHHFQDTDGFVVVAELKALKARVEALETQARG